MPVAQIPIATKTRASLEDITPQVAQAVRESAVRSGLCYVYAPHTTAGLTINENADPSVRRDILATLERLVPRHGDYQHLEGNADAHVKSSLLGHSLTILVENGELVLGTWQGIFFAEFDGPRRRRVLVKVTIDK